MDKHKKVKMWLFILLFIFLIIIGIYSSIDNKKKKLEKDVYQYLIEQKDYKDEDLYSIETYWTQGYGYTTEVTFTDEKDFYYQYIKENKTILQVHWDEKTDPSKKPTPYLLLKPKHAENK